MNVDDMILVSIDDHLIEPPDVFERHMPEKYRDAAPRLVHQPDDRGGPGTDRWIFQGESIGVPGLGAVCTWPADEWSIDPASLSEMRPGAYDLRRRLEDMDVNGVLAGMNFPTFPGFAGTHLAKMPDRDLTNAAISAYNDYVLEEWCDAAPGRFIPLGVLPFFDIEASIAEARRIAAKGAVSVTLPETPYGIGLPDFASGHWDPLFAVLCDLGIVPSLHIGGGFGLVKRPPSALIDDLIMLAPQVESITCVDIMLSGLLRRFPTLKFALSEGGIGWIPFLLDRMDRTVSNQTWTKLNRLPDGKTPTEVFREHFLACFITDPSALRLRDRMGVHTLAWECDYPHSDCTWPASPEFLLRELDAAGCSDDEIHAITWRNVVEFFGWDPFRHVPKERATVGALRARAREAGVDTSTTSRSEYHRRWELAHSS